MINVHISAFAGLPNLNLPLDSSSPLSDLFASISTHLDLPLSAHNSLLLSTTSGHILHPSSPVSLSSLRHQDDEDDNDILTLRLSHALRGGKGGFGSQLRAAGGRMSSRKKSQENSDSCRNLDGRRMRTVKEAKALAALLEVKPEMEKREREARMKRWRDIVEAAERRQEDGGDKKKRFDDSEWLEALEDGKERTREAVLASMRAAGMVYGGEDEDSSGESSSDGGEAEGSGTVASSSSSKDAVRRAVEKAIPLTTSHGAERKFAGWDDGDDEFMSSDEEMEDIEEGDEVEEEEKVVGKGKGKAKA